MNHSVPIVRRLLSSLPSDLLTIMQELGIKLPPQHDSATPTQLGG